MGHILLTALKTFNEILTAGIAITAFSLLLYSLSFNLHDRTTRSFALILTCVTSTFVSEALASVTETPGLLEWLLKLQWVGIIFLPAAYLHLSDALLETTGRPSRGRRRLAVRLGYALSAAFLGALVFDGLVGRLNTSSQPAPFLERTWLTWVFSGYYLSMMAISWVNFWRAYRRTVTRTSRRRMIYLISGALAPLLGMFPFLPFGADLAFRSELLFWPIVVTVNLAVSVLLVIMAYAAAFFGVAWPDRVIKRRLAKWLLRGPVAASITLALTTVVRRLGARAGAEYTALVPFVMVGSILILEHLITLTSPIWERILFRGSEREDVRLLQTLEERLLTASDLQQFLESLLATVCDRLQTSHAFLASFGAEGLELLVSIGGDHPLQKELVSGSLVQMAANHGTEDKFFTWADYLLVPLFDHELLPGELLGLLGIQNQPEIVLDEEQKAALEILIQRAVLALRDRHQELQAFTSLENLTPQIDLIQKLRAAARYDSAEVMASPNPALSELQGERLAQWVKDALTHFWGGPKLTQSPLIQLHVVQEALKNGEDNQVNALRLILRQAIDQVRPEGERKFTADWTLFNILEMKFMEGRKVREIAQRLAMSEADLYRKQRVAIEEVAKTIVEMEQKTRERPSDGI